MTPKRGIFTILFVSAIIADLFSKNTSHDLREKIPQLSFIENKGQVRGFDGTSHEEVLFTTGGSDLTVFVLKNGLAYQFIKSGRKDADTHIETFRMDMELAGINEHVQLSYDGANADNLPGVGLMPVSVRSYPRICYKNIYDGIDWVVYSAGEKLKYDFVVHPGADPSKIRIRYKYQEELILARDGQLQISCPMGEITEHQPVSYNAGKKINTSFVLDKNEITFHLSAYDKKQTLIIDPLVGWSSYFGGGEADKGTAAAGDGLGNIYVAGSSESTNKIASGGYQNNLSGGYDAFLAKFNSAGALVWSTYYGGSDEDLATGCAVDGSGNIFLYGETASQQGIASGGYQNSLNGSRDCFLVKFNAQGTRIWATYFGGSSTENSGGCTVDGVGNIYLSGTTKSSANIASQGAHQPGYNGQGDAFLAKFSSSGSLVWSTYYGGQTDDKGFNCCVDGLGNVYLCGETNSNSYIESNGHQAGCGGLTDAFLVRFSSTGSREWGTYYGGALYESAYACCTDPQGNVFLGGKTNSIQNISSGAGSHQSSYGGNGDAYIAKFNSNGTRAWATYLGGANIDVTNSCISDADGNLMVVGSSVWKFTPGGTKVWEFNNIQPAMFNAGALINGDKLVLCGEAETSLSFISGGYQTSFGGTRDAVIAVLFPCDPMPQPDDIDGPTLVCPVDAYAVYKVKEVPGALSYQWTFPSTWSGSSSANYINVFVNYGGVISVAATGSCGTGPSRQLQVNTKQTNVMNVMCSANPYCEGMKATLTAQGANTFTWAGGPETSTYVVSPIFPTTYTVFGSDQNGCVNKATVEINPDTTTVFNYTIDGLTAYYSIRNLQCNDFEWDFGNGGGSSINPNPIVNYETPGVYSVCLKCGGLPQACVRCIKFNVPSKLIGGVGLVELGDQQAIYVYRNPVHETLEISAPERAPFILVNMLGVVTRTGTLEEGPNSLQLDDLPRGLYFLTIKKDSQVTSLKLLKE